MTDRVGLSLLVVNGVFVVANLVFFALGHYWWSAIAVVASSAACYSLVKRRVWRRDASW